MQLGEISTLVVGDLKVAVTIEWGQLRNTIKTVNKAETNAEVMDAVTEALTKHVVGIEGLTDAKGKNMAWSAATLDKLPPWTVRAIYTKLLNVADEPRESDPLAASTPQS